MTLYDELNAVFNQLNQTEKNMFHHLVTCALGFQSTEEAMAKLFGLMSKQEQQLITDLITPRIGHKEQSTMSWGAETYGYTLRLAPDSPKVIEPKQALLVATLERVTLPINVQAFLYPKSSYTRQFLFFALCPVEPAYSGTLTFPIVNMGEKPITLYPNEGIIQINFFRMPMPEETPDISRYNGSQGVVEFKANI